MRKIVEGSLVASSSVEDQTKWETTRGNEKDRYGKLDGTSKR
jgi:hypothetical protein